MAADLCKSVNLVEYELRYRFPSWSDRNLFVQHYNKISGTTFRAWTKNLAWYWFWSCWVFKQTKKQICHIYMKICSRSCVLDSGTLIEHWKRNTKQKTKRCHNKYDHFNDQICIIFKLPHYDWVSYIQTSNGL